MNQDHANKEWKEPGVIQFHEKDMGEGVVFYIGENPSGYTIRATTKDKARLIAFDYGCRAEFD